MKRILVRGGVNPLKPLSINQILLHNKIGGNSGNVLYLAGVLRGICADDVDVDMDGYAAEGGRYKEADIDRINQVYDAYLIPLADAFRADFVKNLENLTRFVKQLKIPCHIIGVGIRGKYDLDVNSAFTFDDKAKDFVKAVLEKSPMIGLRGEITAKYLTRLGFSEENDYTVIGCPSMYIFGKRIARRHLFLEKDSRISINFNPTIPEIDQNILECSRQYREWFYVAQNIEELRCLWLGLPKPDLRDKFYFADISDELYVGNHVKGFVTAGDWIRYMNTIDLSIGGKFHGNMAAILGGAPAIFIPSDARMQELVLYHSLPAINAKDWKKIDSFEQAVEKVDFDRYLSLHEKNFTHYCGFLEKLGIPNVYGSRKAENDELLLFNRPVSSVLSCSKEEVIHRWTEYKNALERKIKK